MVRNFFRPFRPAYANTLTALIPELWANESLAILEENMVLGNLIHRDFSPVVANYGETVHTRRPGTFSAKRKGVNDDVTIQNATATDVTVKLDQHLHTSFMIRDGEAAKAFKELVPLYLKPAMLSLASRVDQILSAQVQRWNDLTANIAGQLGQISSSTIRQYMLEAREGHNKRKNRMEGRALVVTPAIESAMLGLDEFVGADKVGDQGQALRNALTGRLLGMDVYMAQNTPSINYTDVVNTTTTAAALAGATTISTTVAGVVGDYMRIAGDNTPQLITGVAGLDMTIYPGLKRAVANGAAIQYSKAGAINLAAGYAAGWYDYIATDGWGVQVPKVGQGLRIGTAAAAISGASDKYGIIDVIDLGGGGASILLDRPLATAVVDNAVVAVSSNGEYGFLFNREALSMVMRPLPMAMTGGVMQFVAQDPRGGLAVRSTITYEGRGQGHLVTLDFLMGVAILDTDMGTLLLG